MQESIPEKIFYLIARKLAGEISSDDEAQLDDLLRDDPVMQKKVKIISTFWSGGRPGKMFDRSPGIFIFS